MEEQNKVYIGNLEYSIDEEELQRVIEEKGLKLKEIKIIRDRFTNKSKGFGFAEFEDDEQVQQAIDLLDGHELKSRKLKVNRARRRESGFERRGDFKPYRK
ncbi:MAG: RNA recognition motif domain-containing protein [Candidatus Aminicenantaceae bacterium]